MLRQNKTNGQNKIRNIMKLKNREVFFNLSPLTPDSKTKLLNKAYSNKAKTEEEMVIEGIRARMMEFLRANKSNNERPNLIEQPKIRMLPTLKQPTPAEHNSNTSLKTKLDQATKSGKPSPKHVAQLLPTRRKVEAKVQPNTWNPYLESDANRFISPARRPPPVEAKQAPQVKLTGIVHAQPSLRSSFLCYFDVPGEESSDSFYDIESSSRRF
ncbi:uncharacterized protein LOC115562190 [Drosophila navojoa]|uniref:uncharacterized protein LOC115562190 n=1 Tax=Drosophila navojoa TaxID=7232 RepID=UPI0011BF335F|nr:uncharacterized protein LOC115562190 [Drosophila navojoa]